MPALLGGYELLQRLAVGGMAEVFLARRVGPEGFEKRVALKRILPHLATQPDFVRMFLDEARLAARLDHPHIVHLHDFGRDGDTYYLAMELVAGEDLQSIIRTGHKLSQPIAPAEAATLLVAACEALHHAHEQGVVHRDVTPSNLLVSYDGVIKLADFGIAKAESAAATTVAGALKGKIAYMSPEQAGGQAIDRRSDVYSLGVCAWELLSGRRLRVAETEIEMLAKVQAGEVPRLHTMRRELPRALCAIVERALAREPEARFPTARAFGEALADWSARAGLVRSEARVAAYLGRLFGAGAAERARRVDLPLEPTDVAVPHAQVDPAPRSLRLKQVPAALFHHVAHLPTAMQLHLHLQPLRLPRLRLLLPLVALLLSATGLLLAWRSPHVLHQHHQVIAPPSEGGPRGDSESTRASVREHVSARRRSRQGMMPSGAKP